MSTSDSSSSCGRDPDLLGDLLVGRRAAERRLELADRPLDLPRPRPHRPRHPVERAQLVDDRAADPRDRVRLELDVPLRVVAVDRAHQPEQPVRDEVGLVDVRRQPRAEPPRHVLHERRVVDDQPVAQRLVARPPVLEPEAPAVGFSCHVERIRASAAVLLSAGQRERSHPERRSRPPRSRSPTDRGSALEIRDHGEGDGQHGEQHRHRVSAHARMMPRDRRRYNQTSQPRGVAQLVEHRSPKPGVAGSSPVAPVLLIEPKPAWLCGFWRLRGRLGPSAQYRPKPRPGSTSHAGAREPEACYAGSSTRRMSSAETDMTAASTTPKAP